ncbi:MULTISPECIES: hypothetical protein [unclassified Bradyrhizobium]|uniref:hypothetical protein n=1 Tax=unclassified Bradyrhizobium TaxID=2631580 RepID=UPI0028E67614|nr:MULTISPECIES: hypothetical protein [unclassified Bradyrhizobium]
MKLQILTDDGQPVFAFGPAGGQLLSASPSVAGDVANALHDAQAWLSQDLHVIASIRADISACIGRIEHELGAHPAFTNAQVKLGNAAAHLESYAKGAWKEPDRALQPVTDERGVAVASPPVMSV